MTFEEFHTENEGKGVNFDGKYGNQCMDVVQKYVTEVLQFPPLPGPNALDCWTTYQTSTYQKIENTPDNVPINGDIVIWGTGINQYGHIAIFENGDTVQFDSFDQNWPVEGYVDGNGDFIGTGKAHTQHHNWSSVLGWLHPIMQTTGVYYKGYDLTNQESMKVAVDVLVRVQSGELVDKSQLDDAHKQITALQDSNSQLSTENQDLHHTVDSDVTTIANANQKIADLTKQVQDLQNNPPVMVNPYPGKFRWDVTLFNTHYKVFSIS